MIIAGTGHRPEDAEKEAWVRVRIKNKLMMTLDDKKIDSIITGMAAGFDLWWADEAIELGLPIIAAVPWKGHTPRKEDEELYARVLDVAEKVHYVNEAEDYPGPWVYQDRNVWMVDNATHVMAYLNPAATKGGTWNCCKYARGKKPLYNIWNDPPF